MQVREEKQRLQTLYAQLEARSEATQTHWKMLGRQIWDDFITLGEHSEMMGDSEKEKEIDRQEFFQMWLLRARRVRPGLCTITHALCFTLSLANLKA